MISESKISKILTLSQRSLEIIERWEKIHGGESALLDLALKLFDARFSAAKDYQARLDAAKKEEEENGKY